MGSASVTERSTRGTSVTTSLKGSPAPIWWMWAGCGAHPSGRLVGVGNLRVGMWMFAREATVKCCGVAVAMPQGQQQGSSFVERATVNMGTCDTRAHEMSECIEEVRLMPEV